MSVPEGYKSLGKIGISYKGDYNSNTEYERLDAVFHNGRTYLAIKDAPDGAPRDDKINWIYLAKGFSGDIGDTAITFTEAETRENIDTGESVKTVFGRVKKWFADMTAAAFAQIITSNTDLMATTVAGYLPDALAVKQQFDSVNSKFPDVGTVTVTFTANSNTDIPLNLSTTKYAAVVLFWDNYTDGAQTETICNAIKTSDGWRLGYKNTSGTTYTTSVGYIAYPYR